MELKIQDVYIKLSLFYVWEGITQWLKHWASSKKKKKN